MNIIIAGIILLFTAFNISSFFIGLSKTPQYTTFTGAVHYPMDYLYYLSFIVQGKLHWLRGVNLNSGETTNLEFVNWVYVLGGRIGSFIQLDSPMIYQVMVVVGSLVYLVVAYELICLLFPKQKQLRLLAYVLFLISNAFPRIYQGESGWVFSYFYPFNNFGHPFVRLINVPHHLYIQAAIMGAFLFAVRFWQKPTPKTLIWSGVLGLLLGSMQPLQWAFVTGILSVSGVIFWFLKYRHGPHEWVRELRFALSPSIVMFIGGIIPALYLKQLYTMPPYEFTLRWENWQQINITFRHFVTLNGPLMILALVGLPFVIRRMTTAAIPIVLYAIAAIVIFFSPLPPMLRILNVRFLSIIPTLAIAYIAAETIWFFVQRFIRVRQKIAVWVVACLIMAITFPVTARQLYERTVFPPDDVYIYFPFGASQAFSVLEKQVGERDIVLVDPLFAPQFAAMTGKHVFVSNMFSTVDYDRKIKETARFLYEPMPSEEKMAWLAANHISYIFTYAWTPIDLPGLTELYKNLYAVVYKVNAIP